jgi:GMP synthase-like glutamine amidotransferase
MFVKILSKAATQADLQVEFAHYDVEHEQYPASIDECDGYVITGSKKSVYDKEPWIYRLRDFVVSLDRAKAKLVGICFGHQMVALALGGDTEASDKGWGVGVHACDIITKKAYMQPDSDCIAAIVSHKDQVTTLPHDAELLGTSEFCPNSMFQIQEHILTFQGHPEFCKSYSRALMDWRLEILGKMVYDNGIDSLNDDTQGDILAQWIVRFIAA